MKNPIHLSRLILEEDRIPHVFLSGTEASSTAQLYGLEIVDPSYFYTEHRWNEHINASISSSSSSSSESPFLQGTVGAVALDIHRHLSSATSTGGKTNKWTSRIGDTPIIGSGTYAEDGVVAVSGTGDGDYALRFAVAHDIAARTKHGGQNVI